jgi:hypothetical protein
VPASGNPTRVMKIKEWAEFIRPKTEEAASGMLSKVAE